MAKNKSQLMNCKAHFFMNVTDGNVHTIFEDGDDKVILAAAFASAMMENKYLYDIISAAFLTLLDDQKEKDISNKSKKPVKTAKKSVKKK
jgi:hypothetical protein